jgi:phage shock protein A
MTLFERVSRLMTANLNHAVDKAEEPEVMIKQLVREMEDSIVELRREAVAAIVRVKQVGRKVADAEAAAADAECQASLALDQGDEALARQLLARKLRSLEARDALREELHSSRRLESQLKDDMLRLEEKATEARRRKDELIRRKHAAEARLRSEQASQRSAAAVRAASGRVDELSFDGYAEVITRMEAEAEATRELARPEDDAERRLRQIGEQARVERELDRLRQERALTG